MAVAAIGAVVSADRQKQAGKAQAKAQKEANAIERRMTSIANQRSRQEAVMQAIAAQSANIASGFAYGGTVGSSLQGANASIASTLSGQIGFSNTQLAAGASSAYERQQGANQVNKYPNHAHWVPSVGAIGATIDQFKFGTNT